MPRFYFDVREGWRLTSDRKGKEFIDLDQAEHEAAVTAAAIGRDRFPLGEAREIAVEVRDEHRRWVLTVTVAMRIDRVTASSLAPVA